MNTYEILEKKKEGIGKMYAIKTNLANMYAILADSNIMQADSILRNHSEYKLTTKHLYNRAKVILGQINKKAENLDDKFDEAFYNSVDNIDRVINAMADKVLTESDITKIISYIKNNF
jgi:hypothetical protein